MNHLKRRSSGTWRGMDRFADTMRTRHTWKDAAPASTIIELKLMETRLADSVFLGVHSGSGDLRLLGFGTHRDVATIGFLDQHRAGNPLCTWTHRL